MTGEHAISFDPVSAIKLSAAAHVVLTQKPGLHS